MFFCCLSIYIFGQTNKSKEAIKKAELQKEERERIAEDEYQKALQHKFEIQSKKTKKRMLENKKRTDNFYKKKLGQTFFQQLCPKKRKR